MRDLEREWAWAELPEERELLALCTLAGRPTGVFAPRWLAHLTGLPHLTVHVALATPSGLVLVQRRSSAKKQFPGAWDVAVTGHVSFPPVGLPGPVSLLDAATRELEEELGLPPVEQGEFLRSPGLVPIGGPTCSFAEGESGGRPWFDVEVRQLYGAILTPRGLGALRYSDEELSGILLCRPGDAANLVRGPGVAAGARESLLAFLDWPGFATRRG